MPEDIIAELIGERLQLSDCYRGVIIDGLESSFLPNCQSAMRAVLKGFNNRKYIFVMNTKLDYDEYQMRVKKAEQEISEQEAKKEKETLELIQDMDEDEYDALSETEKNRIDEIRSVTVIFSIELAF